MTDAERRAKRAAYQREWRRRNPEKAAAFVAASKAKKPEKYEQWMRDYYQENREKLLQRAAARYIPHPATRTRQSNEERNAKNRARHHANRDKRLAQKKAWQQANPHKGAEYSQHRRATLLRATPPWANRFFIEEAFDIAAGRTRVTGIPWEVDHVIPLLGRNVRGLHVENNLRVVPRRINRSKGNKVIE